MRHLALPLLLVVLAAPASAQMYGPEYAKCGALNSTTATVDCVVALTKTWDRRLNASYQALMKRSEPSQQEPLKAAQRLWIQYRDANCRFYGMGPGTISQIEVAECVHAMTQQRTCEIESANIGEGKPATGCK